VGIAGGQHGWSSRCGFAVWLVGSLLIERANRRSHMPRCMVPPAFPNRLQIPVVSVLYPYFYA